MVMKLIKFPSLLSYQNLPTILFIFLIGLLAVTAEKQKRFYVVYLGDHDQLVQRDFSVEKHISLLTYVKGCDYEAKESLVYSYTKSFNAFAAKLSEDEAQKLMGITPESDSFKDDGFGPPPTKWKGSCGHFANFSGCNNKLIGAKYFKLDGNPDPADILSPVDVDGHGTHTSSTLAGNPVANASLYGLAKGTSRGAVPSARVAAYKVCWASSGCSDIDILAAFEAAIHDGVDVISISIGGAAQNYSLDSIAVGAFHAMKKGIITVASAGNDGPSWGSVANHAPWLVTVAASGIDREFKSRVELGNGKSVFGTGVSLFDPKQKLYPLVSGADVAKNSASKENARFCIDDTLDPNKVKGKLVYCMLSTWGADSVVKGIGGAGTIIESHQFLDASEIFMAPGTMVNVTVGNAISNYIQSTKFLGHGIL
ncbi:hypothetical protein Dsin_026237 [Dipteronia sinensis]|uniref:Uncharacterized protein n=1 Tax=Dipteronia sinensis TaxID=43782 RepID=A0AAE0DXP5_9ROSI|nr:hypothetical protein Dsin_026237 [Dipteronia sinensis]